MSAQAGIWNMDGAAVDRNILAQISNRLSDYGPDGESGYFDAAFGMLYRPFHTTAESRAEHQPYRSATNKLFVWDGRLDNREELIPQLGTSFCGDQTDIAIVAAAFDKWGPACFSKIVGDWALTVWDSDNKELVLARDYIGIRRLFYYPTPTAVMWCSQLAPLALCGETFTVSEEYVAGYLAFQPDADLTPYREIHPVPPGHYVRVTVNAVSKHQYRVFNPSLTVRYKTDAEYEDQYRHLFRQAVRRRLRADSPILADLSGGLDSSSIVCMADLISATEGVEVPRVDTFSFFDPDEPDGEDYEYFTKVEKQRGRIGFHAEVRAAGDSLSFEYDRFVAVPGFDGRQEVSKALREAGKNCHYRVALSGHGGDELNGQALDFRVQIADSLAQLQLRKAGRQLFEWSLRARYPLVQLLGQSLNLLLPGVMRFGAKSKLTEDIPWINPVFAKRHKLQDRLLIASEGSWHWLPSVRDAFQTVETIAREISFLSQPTIEKRYPYLDQTLVDFLTSIPTEQLLRPGHRRSLMRRSLSSILPPEILTRRTKATTGRCVSLAIQKHWSLIEGVLRSPLSARLGFVDPARLNEALTFSKNGKTPNMVTLLRGLSFELWLRHAVGHEVISIPGSPSSRSEWHGTAASTEQIHDST